MRPRRPCVTRLAGQMGILAGQSATRTVTLKVWVVPHFRGFGVVGPVGVTWGPHGLRVEVMAATPG